MLTYDSDAIVELKETITKVGELQLEVAVLTGALEGVLDDMRLIAEYIATEHPDALFDLLMRQDITVHNKFHEYLKLDLSEIENAESDEDVRAVLGIREPN